MSQIDFLNDFFNDGNPLAVLRLDLPDPLAGGNKSYKLKYNLEEMKRAGHSKVLTFGGAFSNHIAAVAHAGSKNDFETIGIIRGDELHAASNRVLKYAAACGMKLVFFSREDYRRRNDAVFIDDLMKKYGPAYHLPEGGSNALAVNGCMEILSAKTGEYDVIICPVGTGATMAGIIAAAKPHQEVIGIAVLEGKNYLEKEVAGLLQNRNIAATWKIVHEFTLGGYGKSSTVLDEFIRRVKAEFNLPLEPVYSGKALFALNEMKKGNDFNGKRLLFIHTGGYAFTDSTHSISF